MSVAIAHRSVGARPSPRLRLSPKFGSLRQASVGGRDSRRGRLPHRGSHMPLFTHRPAPVLQPVACSSNSGGGSGSRATAAGALLPRFLRRQDGRGHVRTFHLRAAGGVRRCVTDLVTRRWRLAPQPCWLTPSRLDRVTPRQHSVAWTCWSRTGSRCGPCPRALCAASPRFLLLTHNAVAPNRLVLSPRRPRLQTSLSVRTCRWSRCSAGSGGAPPRSE